MSILKVILYKISAVLRCRVINGPDGQAYLERYHLCRLPFGFSIYLHRFINSDPGRGLHNHPWQSALSWVIYGRYKELRMTDAKHQNQLIERHLKAGQFNVINGSIFHRINLIPGEECWSIFIHSRPVNDWGFIQSGKRRLAYHDHNKVLQTKGNPDWWKTATRPIGEPSMRAPL
ncbi:MAG: hypothetical protein ACI8XC_000656 [Gammaproteobacteria bacterium]|jgi:hypothetical protein